ncbi:DUF6497 family protein [Paracoccus aestuariivivens]|uniref:Uncharacterized protein n=1 Tax=Paracoccus aestuariivivens TaxID=1820333 RepID=A0A6L6J7A2_9RHOB|nr:DUF6497 family protein [Paracoccus aestuariivivens]MTH77456.1 hypothetical protein [Paracoccus aestuariivivens]
MKARSTTLCAAFTALTLPANAAQTDNVIKLPSGAEARWMETLHDDSGGSGLTYRFRFLMSDLADRVPSTTGPASEPDVDAARAPVEIDTESEEVSGDGDSQDGQYIDDGMVDPLTLDLSPVEADDAAEVEADNMLDEPALPAAPDVLAQDPLHDDVVWLCQNWVLPRLAGTGPRPRAIMISIADKDIPFGAYDPDVLQLFEAFRLPPDRDECQWEPF